MEPDCDETARGRRDEFSLELWKKLSFKGWEEARGRNAMVPDAGCVGGGAAVCKEEAPCWESREQSGHSLWGTKVIEQHDLKNLFTSLVVNTGLVTTPHLLASGKL